MTEFRCTSAKGANLLFRRMTAGDLDAVVAIETVAHSHPWSRGNFQDCLNVGNQCWIVELEPQAEPEGCSRPVAYAIVSYGGGEAELLNIAVAPQFHRRGIGYCLLAFTISKVQARADTLFLEVRESNGPAIELYDRFGFNEVGVRPSYYPAENGREDALILAKFLEYPCPRPCKPP